MFSTDNNELCWPGFIVVIWKAVTLKARCVERSRFKDH
jgi:hypothetical protein